MKLLLLFLHDYQSQSKPHVPYHSASAQKLTVNEKRIWKEENVNTIMCFIMRLHIYQTTESLLINERDNFDIR